MLKTWILYNKDCEFPIENLPYGVFKRKDDIVKRIGVAIGNEILDLSSIYSDILLPELGEWTKCFTKSTLNEFMDMGINKWKDFRKFLINLLSVDCEMLQNNHELRKLAIISQKSVEMCLPCDIGDYTDFYASIEHATNVGTMFRGKENALMPNWKYLPVGYHGRSSSIIVSGGEINRPKGQLQKDKENPNLGSIYSSSKLMDFELEIGCFIGGGNKLGKPINMEEANNHIFGFVLLNDWSSRDIQKWEYVPLGPFTAKNIATTISPWIITALALEPFKCPTSAITQNPIPHDYLVDPDYRSYNIDLCVKLKNETDIKEEVVICKSNFKNMYWTPKQQLVHHTVTGCNMRSGDLLGSGTISGSEETSYGSMLELCWKGTKEIDCANNGSKRKFLKDYDEVIMEGFCQGDGFKIGFGKCSGKLLPTI